MTGGRNSVSNSGSISGGNCGEVLLPCYSRDVHQLPAELFTAAGEAGITGRSCGRSCFPLPSRAGRSCFPLPSRAGRSCFPLPAQAGRSCFPLPSRAGRSCFPLPSRPGRSCVPRPSRSPQAFRPLGRTCAAQLLALPLRASIGSSRLFRLSPWLPAAFSQGSFLHNHDQPTRWSNSRPPSSSVAPLTRPRQTQRLASRPR